MTRRTILISLCIVALALASCRQVSKEEARELVERYNRAVTEAYRRGDVNLIDSVVGPRSVNGKRLTGLIGARLDMGLTLDAELLALEVTGVEQSKEDLRVLTKERWRYRDLKIGSGEQIGEASLDSYEMQYLFKKIDRAWMVEEIRFTAPPQVGRKVMTWSADVREMHGVIAPATQEGLDPHRASPSRRRPDEGGSSGWSGKSSDNNSKTARVEEAPFSQGPSQSPDLSTNLKEKGERR